MAAQITARTPGTALRKLWEVVNHANSHSFVIISAMHGSWAVDPKTQEDRAKEGRPMDRYEYPGSPDPKRDAAINQSRDAQLQRYLKALGKPVIPIDGLGQEIRTLVDDITKEVSHEQYSAHETSYMVAGVNEAQAKNLCRIFNQDFVIFGAKGQQVKIINRDNTSGAMSDGFAFDDTAFYKAKDFDPKAGPKGEWTKSNPGSATYRSDVKGQPGVGFTFYSDSGVNDAIKEAATRLIATGEIKVSLARVERAWMNWTKDLEGQVRQMAAQGDTHGSLRAMAKFKNLVHDTSKNPEDMVRFLVENALPPAETSRRTVDQAQATQ
jgi:uncharacterized protein (UPF0335 family)